MITENITLNDQTIRLMIIPPSWENPLRVAVRYGTMVTESVTGVEHRRAQRQAPRLRMTYTTILDGGAAQTLREALGALGSHLVAMPIWVDRLAALNWSQRIFDGQVILGWEGGDAFSSRAVGTGGTAPSKAERCPLLIGRLQRPNLTAITDDLIRCELVLEEEGLYAWRVEPAGSSTPPSAWDDTAWPINWATSPEEVTRDLLEYEDIGRGRLKQIQGTAAVRYRQRGKTTLERSSLRELFRFWAARRGALEPFELPSFLQPGAATPFGPHEYSSAALTGMARFSGDLVFDFEGWDIASVDLSFEQVLADDPADGSRHTYAFLYEIRRGDVVHRITDWETSIEVMEETWTPGRIQHDKLRTSLDPSRDSARLTVSLDDAPVLMLLAQGEHEEPVEVTVWEVDLDESPPVARVLHIARVSKPKIEQNVMTCELTWLGGALGRRVPSWNLTTTCNYALLDSGCSMRDPSQMSEAAWETTAKVYEHPTLPGCAILKDVTPPELPADVTIEPSADGYYAGGWLRTGSGIDAMSRRIVWSEWDDTDLILSFARPLIWSRIEEGQVCSLWPGCDGAYATCRAKFANDEAFGGCPQLPEFIHVNSPGGPRKTGK